MELLQALSRQTCHQKGTMGRLLYLLDSRGGGGGEPAGAGEGEGPEVKNEGITKKDEMSSEKDKEKYFQILFSLENKYSLLTSLLRVLTILIIATEYSVKTFIIVHPKSRKPILLIILIVLVILLLSF